MESKSREVNYYWINPRQFIEFNKLIREEGDLKEKKKYIAIFVDSNCFDSNLLSRNDFTIRINYVK